MEAIGSVIDNTVNLYGRVERVKETGWPKIIQESSTIKKKNNTECKQLTNYMVHATRRFNAAFTRAL